MAATEFADLVSGRRHYNHIVIRLLLPGADDGVGAVESQKTIVTTAHTPYIV
jgi:hypothetical protein